MYLAMLNERQKQLFFGLAYHLVSVDGDFSDSERQTLESYCHEMQIDCVSDSHSIPIGDIIKGLKNTCEVTERKIIVFEAIGLALCDSNCDATEREFLDSLMAELDVDKAFARQCEAMLKEYMDFQNRLNLLVIG